MAIKFLGSGKHMSYKVFGLVGSSKQKYFRSYLGIYFLHIKVFDLKYQYDFVCCETFLL